PFTVAVGEVETVETAAAPCKGSDWPPSEGLSFPGALPSFPSGVTPGRGCRNAAPAATGRLEEARCRRGFPVAEPAEPTCCATLSAGSGVATLFAALEPRPPAITPVATIAAALRASSEPRAAPPAPSKPP